MKLRKKLIKSVVFILFFSFIFSNVNYTVLAKNNKKQKVIVIDAGHQTHGNYSTEPIGPGAKQSKAKVSSGTSSCTSSLNEYQLNLKVAKRLRRALVKKGYKVIMVRTKNNVNISNSKRAKIANDAKADAFIRIHANSSDNSNANGMMTICQTKHNPYNKKYYKKSKKLAKAILNSTVKETRAKKEHIWETDTMSGINWSKVPTCILEMGYMSNRREDRKLSKTSYQKKIVKGIAKGLDKYFS